MNVIDILEKEKFKILDNLLKKIFRRKNKSKSLNEFLNIKNIKENYLYTLDGQVILFIKVHPINVDLFSAQELESKMENMSIEFSNEQDSYSILVIPRMVDISENIYFQEKLKNTLEDQVSIDIVEKRIVKQNELIKDKDIIENEFYLCIWDKSSDETESKLEKRAETWISRFRNCEFKSEILEKTDIILLIKSFTIPEFARKEGTDYRDNIVRIKRRE